MVQLQNGQVGSKMNIANNPLILWGQDFAHGYLIVGHGIWHGRFFLHFCPPAKSLLKVLSGLVTSHSHSTFTQNLTGANEKSLTRHLLLKLKYHHEHKHSRF